MIQTGRIDQPKADRVLANIYMQSLDMEENENISISKINNMVLQIILREHDFNSHHRTGEMW
jgi:hypothetical protein